MAEAVDGIEEPQRAALQALCEQYLHEHARLSRSMAKKLYDVSVTQYRAEPLTYRDERAQQEQAYIELSEDREQLNAAQPPRIRAMLSPEQNERLSEWKYEKEPPKKWHPRGSGNMRRRQPQPASAPSVGSEDHQNP